MPDSECVFCNKPEEIVVFQNEHAKAFFSEWPIVDYHLLTVPKRHVASEKELTYEEVIGITEVRLTVTDAIREITGLVDYNAMLNEGSVAGRTVHHLHWHTVPRKEGDLQNSPMVLMLDEVIRQARDGPIFSGTVKLEQLHDAIMAVKEMATDSVGGIRNVIPGMGDYKKYGILIPNRRDAVSAWTAEVKKVLRDHNQKGIAGRDRTPLKT